MSRSLYAVCGASQLGSDWRRQVGFPPGLPVDASGLAFFRAASLGRRGRGWGVAPAKRGPHGGPAQGRDCSLLPGDGERHVMTGVCDRDRRPRLARVVVPGRVFVLPKLTHAHAGGHLIRSHALDRALSSPLGSESRSLKPWSERAQSVRPSAVGLSAELPCSVFANRGRLLG